jgi:hypothetical protein
MSYPILENHRNFDAGRRYKNSDNTGNTKDVMSKKYCRYKF